MPQRVSRLVLVSPIGLWRDDAPVKNWMSMSPESVARIAFYDPEGPLAKEALTLPEDREAQIDAQVHMTWTLGCTGKLIWPIPDKGLKKRLHRIQAPTLIIWGKHDGLAPSVYAEEFASRIPGARAEIVDRAGHVPHLEQLDTVTDLVQGFLKG